MERVADRRPVGDVDLVGHRVGALPAELERGALGRVAVPIQQRDPVAVGREPAGDTHPMPDAAPVTTATRLIAGVRCRSSFDRRSSTWHAPLPAGLLSDDQQS